MALGSGVHNWEVHERQETRPKLHSGRRSDASKGLTLLSFSHFQDAHGSRQKIGLKLPTRQLHKAAPLSRLAVRRPPLQRLPHHHTPPPRLRPSFSRARDPARRRRPRKQRSASSAARRHGGSPFTCPGPARPAGAMSPPSQGGHRFPGLAAPALPRPGCRVRPPVEQRCSPWWRMAVDSPRQTRGS